MADFLRASGALKGRWRSFQPSPRSCDSHLSRGIRAKPDTTRQRQTRTRPHKASQSQPKNLWCNAPIWILFLVLFVILLFFPFRVLWPSLEALNWKNYFLVAVLRHLNWKIFFVLLFFLFIWIFVFNSLLAFCCFLIICCYRNGKPQQYTHLQQWQTTASGLTRTATPQLSTAAVW